MSHDFINKRSLALNRLVVEKIRRQPELMRFVNSNLERALNDPKLSESCKDALREWEEIFRTLPLRKVLDVLVEESGNGERLRQSTPFWGVLTPLERQRIFAQYESARA